MSLHNYKMKSLSDKHTEQVEAVARKARQEAKKKAVKKDIKDKKKKKK